MNTVNIDLRRKKIFLLKADVKTSKDILIELKEKRFLNLQNFIKDIDKISYTLWGETPISRDFIPAGTFHAIFKVQIKRNNYYFFKFKIFNQKEIAYAFIINKFINKILIKNNIPISPLIYTDITKTLSNYDFEITSQADGFSIASCEDRETQFIKPTILENLGKTLKKIHNLNFSGYGPIAINSLLNQNKFLGLFNSWEEYLFLNFEEHINYCLINKAITQKEKETILVIAKNINLIVKNTQSCLLHGDLSGSNIFTDGFNITAIIDWEDCILGDPIFDIALWGTFYRNYLRDFMINGYTNNTPLTHKQEIKYWFYYLRIALCKTAHRDKFEFKDNPNRPPPSLRIQNALSHIQKLF
jgi:fructosamine-3-kinase